MYDALTLKGVECIQVNNLYDQDDPSLPSLRHEIPPNRYHRISEHKDFYREYYLFQEGDTEETIREWETTKKGAPVTEIEYEDDFFGTVENLKEYLLEPLIDKKYEDFVYQKDTKEYLIDFYNEYFKENCISAVKFSNKKAVEFTTWLKSSDREHFIDKIKFGYKEIIPIPPVK